MASPSPRPIPIGANRWSPEALVEGLKARRSEAAAAFYDRVGSQVNRMVGKLLGPDREHDDVVHQVFVNCLQSIHTLRDPHKLEGWVSGVSVYTVRRELRRRRTWRRFHVFWPDRDFIGVEAAPPTSALATRLYLHLKDLAADERIAFVLRVLEQQPLADVAAACDCSLATAKRRVARATTFLESRAANDPTLREHLRDQP